MIKLRFEITKEEEIRYISHLDYARAIERAIRRSKLPAGYSEGFNPHMKLAFASALAVGITSTAEYMDIELVSNVSVKEAVGSLSRQLPAGITIKQAKIIPANMPKLMAIVNLAAYIVKVPCSPAIDIDFLNEAIKKFNAAENIIYIKKSPKGERQVNVKEYVDKISIVSTDNQIEFVFEVLITPSGSIKPSEVLEAFINEYSLPINKREAVINRTGLFVLKNGDKRTPLDMGEERTWAKR